MISLLVKDIPIQRRFIALGFVFIGVFFFALGAFEGLPLAMPAAIFSHFLIVVASKYDERNNNGRMLASFPVSRWHIVTAKYISIAMFIFISFALTGLWRLLAGTVLPVSELPWFSVQSVVLALVALLLFYAVYFPLFFAAGSRLGQVLDLIVIFAVGGVALIAIRILEWANAEPGLLLQRLFSADSSSALLWLSAVGIAAIVVSWVVSLRVYAARHI